MSLRIYKENKAYFSSEVSCRRYIAWKFYKQQKNTFIKKISFVCYFVRKTFERNLSYNRHEKRQEESCVFTCDAIAYHFEGTWFF